MRDRLLACVGACVAILITAAIGGALYGSHVHLPLVVAPIGASAVLLFAVPSSPLAQPWPIVGGNTISAVVGVAVAHIIDHTALAAAVSVSLAILIMSIARCLHPPGGASALTAVVGGPAITNSGYLYPLLSVGLGSLVLVVLGVLFHVASRKNYPHRVLPAPRNTHGTEDPPAPARVGFQHADVEAALELLDETFDIDPGDLERLLRQVEMNATVRTQGLTLCGEIMSRDVISVHVTSPAADARALLLKHNLRVLPVLGRDEKLEGVVGLRELTGRDAPVGELKSSAVTGLEDDAALSLVPALVDGRAHAVIIVTDEQRIKGLVTQTDLLAFLAQQMNKAA